LFYLLPLVRLENHGSLSHGVQVAGVAWRAATRIVAGLGDLVQRTMDGHTGRVLGGQAIERSGDAVCGLHRVRGDEKRGFLG
jgi:molybdenum-dependent DNA-binding transcriptional regulator ModE